MTKTTYTLYGFITTTALKKKVENENMICHPFAVRFAAFKKLITLNKNV